MKKTAFIFILAINITGLVFPLDIDEVRELLIKEEGGSILYLSKINLGIPGGENWIANRVGRSYVLFLPGREERREGIETHIYTISNDKKVRRESVLSFQELSELQYLDYDILEGIPGTQLGSIAAKFGDFNGDGKDEIFSLGISTYSRCVIEGYDSIRGMYFLFNCPFKVSGPEGPVPVIFTNYQGTDGIAVQVRKHIEERDAWYFFAWNEEIKEYEEIKEIREDEIDFSMITDYKRKRRKSKCNRTGDRMDCCYYNRKRTV